MIGGWIGGWNLRVSYDPEGSPIRVYTIESYTYMAVASAAIAAISIAEPDRVMLYICPCMNCSGGVQRAGIGPKLGLIVAGGVGKYL